MYNTYLTILIPGALSFIATIGTTRFLRAYLYGAGIIAEDRNKERPVKLASSGGLAVAFGIIVGILAYTFGGSFIFKPVLNISQLLAIALSIVLISLIGFLDDINVKGRKVQSTDMMDIRQGLKQWQKPLLTVIGALPLMSINAGISTVTIPYFGTLNLGILYPLIVLPIAIVFVSNAVNLLGGFDGLQPSMTLIASAGLFIYCIITSSYMGALLSLLLILSILAFLPFNLRNASIIPGDSFTYAVGATLVAIMAMGNAEAFGFVIYIPWLIEFFLHLRRGFKVTDLGIRQRDGTFKPPYGKHVYSLTHLVMNLKRAKEHEVTLYLSMLEIFFVVLAFLLKLGGLL